MCLWYIQRCHVCNTTTFNSRVPIEPCDISACQRRLLDPVTLTAAEEYQFLTEDYSCTDECSHITCGLVTRDIVCGARNAIRYYCKKESDHILNSSGDSDDYSEDD